MLASSLEAEVGSGGIAEIVRVYQRAGLFDKNQIIFISTRNPRNNLTKLVSGLVGLLKYIANLHKAEIVHIHLASGWSFIRKSLFLIFGKTFGKKVILHVNGAEMGVYYEKASPWLKRYIENIFDRADLILALSQDWKKVFRKITKKTKIDILYNPIDMGEEPDFSKKIKNQFLFIGRIGERKGIYDVLAAMKDLVKKHPDFIYKVGGDGELDKLNQEIKKNKLERNVENLGWVKGELKEELLNKSGAFVMPSYNEGFPLAILEAMSNGLCVVTSPVGGIPELIKDGKNGFLVEPGDVKAIYKVLDDLLNNPAKVTKMGKRGWLTAKNKCSAEVVVKRLDRIYQEL